jgi:hypothetical protein
MLVEPVKDLFDAFIIGAVKRLVTVATVESQHFKPWESLLPERAPKQKAKAGAAPSLLPTLFFQALCFCHNFIYALLVVAR